MLSKYKTITICGGEGSGKSTYCNMLEKYVNIPSTKVEGL